MHSATHPLRAAEPTSLNSYPFLASSLLCGIAQGITPFPFPLVLPLRYIYYNSSAIPTSHNTSAPCPPSPTASLRAEGGGQADSRLELTFGCGSEVGRGGGGAVRAPLCAPCKDLRAGGVSEPEPIIPQTG